LGEILNDERYVSIYNASVVEGHAGATSMNFTVTLSAPYDAPVTVEYATADGSATAGSGDYQATSGSVTFDIGQTTQTISIPVNGDRLGEGDENFSVTLDTRFNPEVWGTIVDDEPRVSISDVTRSEGRNRKTTLFSFTVTLSAAYDQPVTMSFRTVDGTAKTSDGDYIAKSGTLTFAPGETTKTITIEVKGDSKKEANEAFFFDLFGLSSNALFTKNRGIGTILNDD
jgi:urease beta subunit